jgi:hypothetical protein
MLLTNYRQLLVKSDTIQDLIQVLKSFTYGKDGHGGSHLLFTWNTKVCTHQKFQPGSRDNTPKHRLLLLIIRVISNFKIYCLHASPTFSGWWNPFMQLIADRPARSTLGINPASDTVQQKKSSSKVKYNWSPCKPEVPCFLQALTT